MSYCLPKQRPAPTVTVFANAIGRLVLAIRNGLPIWKHNTVSPNFPRLSAHLRRDIGLPADDENRIRDEKNWNDPINVEIRRIW